MSHSQYGTEIPEKNIDNIKANQITNKYKHKRNTMRHNIYHLEYLPVNSTRFLKTFACNRIGIRDSVLQRCIAVKLNTDVLNVSSLRNVSKWHF